MAQRLNELIYAGFPGRVANALAMTGTGSISAAGTVQADATLLTTSLNLVTTATASTGVRLPPTKNATNNEPLHFIVIRNAGANTINIFPAVGESINDGAADAAITLSASAGRILYTLGDGVWVG